MFIMEDIGKKSQTYKEGTFSYMSEEMKSLDRVSVGLWTCTTMMFAVSRIR